MALLEGKAAQFALPAPDPVSDEAAIVVEPEAARPLVPPEQPGQPVASPVRGTITVLPQSPAKATNSAPEPDITEGGSSAGESGDEGSSSGTRFGTLVPDTGEGGAEAMDVSSRSGPLEGLVSAEEAKDIQCEAGGSPAASPPAGPSGVTLEEDPDQEGEAPALTEGDRERATKQSASPGRGIRATVGAEASAKIPSGSSGESKSRSAEGENHPSAGLLEEEPRYEPAVLAEPPPSLDTTLVAPAERSVTATADSEARVTAAPSSGNPEASGRCDLTKSWLTTNRRMRTFFPKQNLSST